MKDRRFLLPAILAVCFFSTDALPAQLVPHHSYSVNNEGNVGECMSCHDGTMSKHVTSCTVQCTVRDPHAINTVYPPPDRIESFRTPEEVLAAGIRLPGGMISCISCHDLRNPARHHLSAQNGSVLCIICHII